MNLFYLRWVVILVCGAVVTFMGVQRYYNEVSTISPEQVLSENPSDTIRMMGTIEGGSLQKDEASEELRFSLSHEGVALPVRYTGASPDGVRELKTIVVIGEWIASQGRFDSSEIAVVPNYGFISAAYLVSFIPIIFFLFYMEHRVKLLYTQIKGTKAYKAEEMGFDKE